MLFWRETWCTNCGIDITPAWWDQQLAGFADAYSDYIDMIYYNNADSWQDSIQWSPELNLCCGKPQYACSCLVAVPTYYMTSMRSKVYLTDKRETECDYCVYQWTIFCPGFREFTRAKCCGERTKRVVPCENFKLQDPIPRKKDDI